MVDTKIVSVVTKVVCERAGQSVTDEGQAVTVDVRVVKTVEVVIVTSVLEGIALAVVIEPEEAETSDEALGDCATGGGDATTEEDGMAGLLDDPGMSGALDGLDAGKLDLTGRLEGVMTAGVEDGVTETATEEDGGRTGLLDDPGMDGTLEGLDAGKLNLTGKLEGVMTTGAEDGVIDAAEEEAGRIGLLDDPGMNGALDGLDAGELDFGRAEVEGVALLDWTGVDGATGAELGTIGLLEDDGIAELESRGLVEVVTLITTLDDVGLGAEVGAGVDVVHD